MVIGPDKGAAVPFPGTSSPKLFCWENCETPSVQAWWEATDRASSYAKCVQSLSWGTSAGWALLPVPGVPGMGCLCSRRRLWLSDSPARSSELEWEVQELPGGTRAGWNSHLEHSQSSHCLSWEEPRVFSQSQQPSLSSIPPSLPLGLSWELLDHPRICRAQEQLWSRATPQLSLQNSWSFLFNSAEFSV